MTHHDSRHSLAPDWETMSPEEREQFLHIHTIIKDFFDGDMQRAIDTRIAKRITEVFGSSSLDGDGAADDGIQER